MIPLWALAQTASNLEPFFLGYGVLGVMFLMVLFGWIAPKWVLDLYRERERVKDEIIQELTAALHRLADDRIDEAPAKTTRPKRRRVNP